MASYRPFPSVVGVLGLVLVATVSCFAPTETVGFTSLPGDYRVLFIGNSHTTMNDLPGMLNALAEMGGDTSLQVGSLTNSNWSLMDHWNNGIARKALRETEWEFVVMQQGTSALPENQVALEEVSALFAPLIRDAGAEPVLYQIWAQETQPLLADDALKSYHNAAVAAAGFLAPAGDAFTAALAANPDMGVYALDGFHASVRGTYLAALVILARISDIQPDSLPSVIPGSPEIPGAVVDSLKVAAVEALARNPALPTVRIP